MNSNILGAIEPQAELTNDLLGLPVRGLNLHGPRFEDNLDPQGCLLVFLRHLGCTFCRETVADLRQAVTTNKLFPAVLFVYQGSINDGQKFFKDKERWPEARAIADEERKLYSAFNIKRGTTKQLLGPQTLIRGLEGVMRGHGIGVPVGDPLLMPGMFFIRGKDILWQHEYAHAGDRPNYTGLIGKLHFDS